MIAVDTSVWIDLFEDAGTPQAKFFERLLNLEEEDFALTDVVLAEILQGARSEREALRLERHLADFEVLRLRDLADFRRAAAMYRSARQEGITIRRTSDCLIAAVCVREDVPLLHSDGDFDRLASVSTLSIVDYHVDPLS
jgi:predicted nucleic acid-binding protein